MNLEMIETQIDFWSSNPCGTDGTLQEAKQQRYRIEPWLPRELRTIPTDRKKYLEVGCGQGVDSFYICAHLSKECEYTAIDYSTESVKWATGHVDEAIKAFNLQIIPKFSNGDALALDFGDGEFDFVYSMGVLHHTPDPQKAINEIYRILKSGGQAKIFLYRRNSLKVGVAKLLRSFQALGGKFFFQDRFIYKMLKHKKSRFFGSMFLECFGVPWMEWYSESELRVMFKEFETINIEPYGFNFPRFSDKEIEGHNEFGYFYKIDVKK